MPIRPEMGFLSLQVLNFTSVVRLELLRRFDSGFP